MHWRMLLWSLHQRSLHDCLDQIVHIVGPVTNTAAGMFPNGNPGGANVSPLRRMPVAPDLQAVIDQARRH